MKLWLISYHHPYVINPRRACARVIVVVLSVYVCVCVCLSVKSHLTSGASFCPENVVKYSVCNVGRKVCGILSETVLFQSYHTSFIVWVLRSRPFYLWEYVSEPAII